MMCIRSCAWLEVKSMASVTAVSIERHAGDRLRRSDLRDVYDVSMLISAAEAELGAEVSYAVMQEWLTV